MAHGGILSITFCVGTSGCHRACSAEAMIPGNLLSSEVVMARELRALLVCLAARRLTRARLPLQQGDTILSEAIPYLSQVAEAN